MADGIKSYIVYTNTYKYICLYVRKEAKERECVAGRRNSMRTIE